jgi:hypothetical protein
MLTLIVRTGPQAAPLIETLTPLIGGVVEGLFGRLFLVSDAEHAEIQTVAHEAGAELIVAASWSIGLMQAARLAKGPGLFVAEAGTVSDASLFTALERFFRLYGRSDKMIGATRSPASLKGFLAAPLVNVTGRITREQMVVIDKQQVRGDVWRQSFGRKRVLLDTVTRRL